MDISANLRLNMTGAEGDPAARSARYQAAIDMAAYADQQGFSSVNVEEHHVAENGWLPSPLTMAAAIAPKAAGSSTRIGSSRRARAEPSPRARSSAAAGSRS